MSRTFTAAERQYLYVASEGLCNRCGGDLNDDWQAHHVQWFSRDGRTELYNAEALCLKCHRKEHRMKTFTLLDWQNVAVEIYEQLHKKFCLFEISGGAGKTIFAGACIKRMLDRKEIDFAVFVVPLSEIKGSDD